jgi:outer membrane protein assembly factor BamD (BamD/ComL family)
LRQAQEAVAGDRFEAALAPLAEHARRFPSGRLVEEREALRVQALAKLGRVAEARQVAQAFRARFPRSVLLPRVGELPGARE